LLWVLLPIGVLTLLVCIVRRVPHTLHTCIYTYTTVLLHTAMDNSHWYIHTITNLHGFVMDIQAESYSPNISNDDNDNDESKSL
jgi:hypothetical protein